MATNTAPGKPKGFHKRGTKTLSISGAKPSIHNNTLLVSSGVPSLDALIGGGIAVGSCLLVDEDKYSTYSSLILKYYLAEAVTNKHKVFLASANQPPSQIIQDLPQLISHTPTADTAASKSDTDDLSIAWRYKNVPTNEASYGHYYDVTKVMSKEHIDEADIALFDPHAGGDSGSTDTSNVYCKLLENIRQQISKHQLSTSQKTPPQTILRIAISAAGSPFWSEDVLSLSRFMYSLKSILRTSYAVCMLTVPGHLIENLGPLVRFSDCAIQFISFADNPEKYSKNPAFKEFHGLLKIPKLPCINSLVCHLPDTMDWVFKLKRKKLTIEKMHLPPDLSETVSRSQEAPLPAKSASSTLCASTAAGSALDF